jgi:hypothetical protein
MNLLDRTKKKALLISQAETIIDSMVANDKDYMDIIATITLLIGDEVNTTDKISILDISARYYRKVKDENNS